MRLEVGDGHTMWYECHGSPAGRPVVMLHGGPGGGLVREALKLFDLRKWHVILYDQRGCGRSEPSVEKDLEAALSHNTTWDLVADIERLRTHLGIQSWTVFGGSWGTTLALAYAEKHPEAVSALVLRGVCLMSPWENRWLYEEGGASQIAPEAWKKFVAPLPGKRARKARTTLRAYQRLLKSRTTRRRAAAAWWGWESANSYLKPRPDTTPPAKVEAISALENHYFLHNAWLRPGQLLANAHRIAHIPLTLVHGRYDLVCPVRAALELKDALPHAKLYITPDAGHAMLEPGNFARLRKVFSV
jgi:proline iminopeptidase